MITFVRAYSHEEVTDILLRAKPAELARNHGDLLEHRNHVARIGRSGSVSRWVQDRYHPLPEWRWAALHRRCQPRAWLLDLLERAEAERG